MREEACEQALRVWWCRRFLSYLFSSGDWYRYLFMSFGNVEPPRVMSWPAFFGPGRGSGGPASVAPQMMTCDDRVQSSAEGQSTGPPERADPSRPAVNLWLGWWVWLTHAVRCSAVDQDFMDSLTWPGHLPSPNGVHCLLGRQSMEVNNDSSVQLEWPSKGWIKVTLWSWKLLIGKSSSVE